ncbi:MAG: SDR family NAD(P)-dependent oxidoreductase [Edaphobacter sp.]|uniref:SDR family NAD(P)-dependent oxidoreductase n=1 Tax=Edaphobacter sp. TaxID=1934404 RepID=UPI0023841AD3|nr:SDR family NAD(P)-dependent oxidoreductase [Edaphobacter sp.]MDE1175177.1 SDR family NAD(P)-dependent oxidoreductase [Edaphobacter sp.]
MILGSGVNSDGRTLGLSMPNGDAQERLLRKVYAQCGLKAEDVFYVEAHGTGTTVGDPIECGALGRVLGAPREDGSFCKIGSVKSNIGHLEAASGIAGLIKVLLSLRHHTIPGNLHFETPNPKIDFEGWKLDVVAGATPIPASDRSVIVGVNSFGFGGTNAHLVLEEYCPAPAEEDKHAQPEKSTPDILLLSGHSQAALAAVAEQYAAFLRNKTESRWSAICAAVANSRSLQRYRLAVSAKSALEAAEQLEHFLAGKAVRGLAQGSSPASVVPLTLVYSGNGPQWWGMGRELLVESAVFRAAIDEIDQIFHPLAGWSLLDEMRKPQSESRVALTEFAQPLLFALQVGLTSALRQEGIVPAAVVGHSVGEVAAAYVSGALTLEDAVNVIYFRSLSQSKTAGGGRMAALGISAREAFELIDEVGGWIELAAENAPDAVTVAGDVAVMDLVVQLLTERGKFARLLPLNYAFHSRSMESIRTELLESLQTLRPRTSRIPFISTVSGTEVDGAALDASYWYRNVRERVEFREAIADLVQERHSGVFLEVGPHPVLKEYVQQTAKVLDHTVVSLQTLRRPGPRGPEPETGNLWTAICACYAHGAVDVSAVFQRSAGIPELPQYPWQRLPHWRGSVILPDIHHPTHRDHPLLGYRMTTGEGIWENTFDLHRIPYLKDHVVQRSVVFPAAGYIQMAFAAAERVSPGATLMLEDIVIQRPLAISEQIDPLVQISVDNATGIFEVRSRQEQYSSEWVRHARGRIGANESTPLGLKVDLDGLLPRMTTQLDSEAHYLECSRRGLDYGSDFQGVDRLLMSPVDSPYQEAVATIRLPLTVDPNLSQYRAHPALLDSCFQMLISLVAQRDRRDTAVLPVSFGRIISYGTLPESFVCHLIIRHESERTVVADFHLVDAAGNLLLLIEESRSQKANFNAGSTTPLIAESWTIDPGYRSLILPAALPEPHAVKEMLKDDLAQIILRHDCRSYYSEIQPRFDLLARAFVAEVIDDLRGTQTEFDASSLISSVGSSEDLQRMESLIKLAADHDVVFKQGQGWKRGTEILPAADALWKELFQDHPRYQSELLQLSRTAESLRRTSMDSDFNTAKIAEPAFEFAPFQLVYSEIARAAVQKIVASWPSHRPVRVLELNGKDGALTAWLLPVLPIGRTDYVLTDASEALLGRAEQRLKDYSSARYMTIDPEQDLTAQGLSEDYFDLVIVSGIFRALASPATLLKQIHRLLAAGGYVMLTEVQRTPASDLMFLRSLRTPHDASEVTGHAQGFVSWKKFIEAEGFASSVILSDEEACAAPCEPRQAIVLAQRDNRVSEMASIPREFTDVSASKILTIFEDDHDQDERLFQGELVDELRANGCEVETYLVRLSDGGQNNEMQKIWTRSGPYDHVIYIAAPSLADLTADKLVASESARCAHVLDAVRVIETTRQDHTTQLTIVTRGVLRGAFGGGPADPAQAPIWGLGRVIGNEHHGLSCHLVDCPSDTLAVSQRAHLLARELLQRDDETEVQLADGFRFVNRDRVVTLSEQSRHPNSGDRGHTESFVLDFVPQGGLDSLYLRAVARRKPGPGQVEIAVKAAGLNFRDVLWTMGMLPEEAVEEGFSGPTIGMECAGEIVQVGSDVGNVKVGDRVVAFASSSFAGFVTTDSDSVSLIPDGMPYPEASTIPTAFLTAYYALDHLAQLQPNEIVLIHGAAGGVGLAAIQVAKLRGARIIGTAGSERKRRMLEMLGVDHVLNSRSLEFADEVMRLTGDGVDVVLNSLAGEAITRSLKCLKPFGRFLEIGKRDLYDNTHLGLRPFRKNLSYFAIDADTLLVQRRGLARSLFHAVMEHFASGALKPLPFEQIPISRASEAFRAMQQSRHVGKLILSMELDSADTLPVVRTQSIIRKDATYLVTGGLGGFGLATAKWLAEQGATSLVLIGRRGAVTEEAKQGVALLQRSGVQVKTLAMDIANFEIISEALHEVRATMPPIAGVIHSAAVIEDAPVLQINPALLSRVLTPKIAGAWNLHLATLNDPIEMFVLYSSSSTVVGNPGQGAYVAANFYLDALAQHRQSLGLPALAVGWGAIKDVGFLTRHENVAEMLRTRTGMDATPSEEALSELGRLTAAGVTRMCVARFDLQKLGRVLPGTLVPRFYPIITPAAASSLSSMETLANRLQQVPMSEKRSLIVEVVREHAAKVLGMGMQQIDPEQPLADLGLDSLMAVELALLVEHDVEKPVSVMQVLSAGSVYAIADFALRVMGNERTEAPIARGEETAITAGLKG